MFLEILTPDKKVFEGEATSVNLPGSDGYFEVLPKHASIISTLDKGSIKINEQGKITELLVDGGVVEVHQDKVIVLAEAIL
jgi:F-type H+-transporting ATPase subunit epsilon